MQVLRRPQGTRIERRIGPSPNVTQLAKEEPDGDRAPAGKCIQRGVDQSRLQPGKSCQSFRISIRQGRGKIDQPGCRLEVVAHIPSTVSYTHLPLPTNREV